MNRFCAVILIHLIMVLNAHAQDSSSGARWQLDWTLYVAEVEKHLQGGEDPNTEVFKKSFVNRVVTFEGTIREKWSGEPNKFIVIKMSPVSIKVPTKLFSGGSSAIRPEITPTVDVLSLTPAASSLEVWKSLDVGEKVRFKARLGDTAVFLTRTQTRSYQSVAVFFEVMDAEILGQ